MGDVQVCIVAYTMLQWLVELQLCTMFSGELGFNRADDLIREIKPGHVTRGDFFIRFCRRPTAKKRHCGQTVRL